MHHATLHNLVTVPPPLVCTGAPPYPTATRPDPNQSLTTFPFLRSPIGRSVFTPTTLVRSRWPRANIRAKLDITRFDPR
ncbi:hypothetical protein Mapa_016522 [Marchantia paleacea]|nr:hypothetical protein Mapa_016522 [Marchantia paleacea]